MPIEQHVLRLQIPIDDLPIVKVLQRFHRRRTVEPRRIVIEPTSANRDRFSAVVIERDD